MQAALLIALAAALTVAQADFISRNIASENARTVCSLRTLTDCASQAPDAEPMAAAQIAGAMDSATMDSGAGG